MSLNKTPISGQNVGMEGARGSRVAERAPTREECGGCGDPATAYISGQMYCGWCALRQLIAALRAEVEDADMRIDGDDG